MTGPIFDPLALPNLGDSLANALLRSDATPLMQVQATRFTGSGIYAIYYRGSFPAYRLISQQNLEAWKQPIYVGKAVPDGSRRGLIDHGSEAKNLRARLMDHRLSIRRAANLDIDDFVARWLVLEPLWVHLGETILIRRIAPVWNQIIDGFGNHGQGSGRHAGEQSRWDKLHPGRTGVDRFKERSETREAIIADVEEYLRARIDPE